MIHCCDGSVIRRTDAERGGSAGRSVLVDSYPAGRRPGELQKDRIPSTPESRAAIDRLLTTWAVAAGLRPDQLALVLGRTTT